jgi:hypothetical protein
MFPPEDGAISQKSDVRGCEDPSVSQSRLVPDILAIGHLPKLDCICVLIIPVLRPSGAAFLPAESPFQDGRSRFIG